MLGRSLSSSLCYMIDKLVASQCLSMGPAELQPDFCEQNKESSSFSQRNRVSYYLSNVRHLAVDVITEFTAGIFPQFCLKQTFSTCKTVCPGLEMFSEPGWVCRLHRELAQHVSCEWNLSVPEVTQSLLAAQVLVCREALWPVELVQISAVVDYEPLGDDLPLDL